MAWSAKQLPVCARIYSLAWRKDNKANISLSLSLSLFISLFLFLSLSLSLSMYIYNTYSVLDVLQVFLACVCVLLCARVRRRVRVHVRVHGRTLTAADGVRVAGITQQHGI